MSARGVKKKLARKRLPRDGLRGKIGKPIRERAQHSLTRVGRALGADWVLVIRGLRPRGKKQRVRFLLLETENGTVLSDSTEHLVWNRKWRAVLRTRTAAMFERLREDRDAKLDPPESQEDESLVGASGDSEIEERETVSDGRESDEDSQADSTAIEASREAAIERDDDNDSTQLVLKKKRRKGENRPMISFGLRFHFGRRTMDYNDVVTSNLRPHSASGSPGLGVFAEFYPLRRPKHSFLRFLGIEGAYDMFSVADSTVEDVDQVTVQNSWSSWRLGLKKKFLFGPVDFGVLLSYGMLSYGLTSPEGSAIGSEVPSVKYNFLRPGLSLKINFGRMHVFTEAGYLQMLSNGSIKDDFFPRASSAGLDAQLGLGMRLFGSFETRLSVDYTRVFYSLRPEVGDTYVAGGALDQFYRAHLAFIYSI